MRSKLFTAALLAALLTPAPAPADDGRVGPSLSTTANGRLLRPAGRMTTVGNFPSGGGLTPGGRFFWAIDSGHGHNDATIVDVASGAVRQVLPLPGAYGAVAFSADGRRAYISGEPKGSGTPAGPTKGDEGDVIHVFDVDPGTGRATERDPIALPSTATAGGSGQVNSLPPSTSPKGFPQGLAVTPDGRTLVVALNQADRAAIVDTRTGAAKLVKVGRYPFGAAISADGRAAYVSNEYDGTVSVVDLGSAAVTTTIAGLGGPLGDRNAHPEGLLVRRDRLYVAVTNRDLVQAVDLRTERVVETYDVSRRGALGVQPVALAVSPGGTTLYAADAGEDAIAAIALTGRRGARAGRLVGRIPTAAYPTGVATAGGRLVWVAAKGLGAGPNPAYSFYGSTPYGEYVPQKLLGRVGVLGLPSDAQVRALTARADAQVVPHNHTTPPAGTALRPGGPIEHVFYIVRENRTYDQVFGSDPRGDGDPSLQLFDDNGVGGPTGGVTPNAHALARDFPLLDHFYADSEVSVDGHLITSGGVAIDYAQRALHANYSGRGHAFDFGIFPVTFGPNDFVFDQAARQGVAFRDYGEQGAGNTPFADDGRPTWAQSAAAVDPAYPGNVQIGCLVRRTPNLPVEDGNLQCTHDSGRMGATGTFAEGRATIFANELAAQDAGGTVPAFNYLILPNDHTNGGLAGGYTPKALIADNDLALGQIVEAISHSSIWRSSAIIVVEDDSQDGADHVDAHRMPAFVISPWAKRGGAVVQTRYDQYSALRTAEMLLGLRPLSLNDALATPMYDAFRTDGTPDVRPYTAIQPEQSLTEVNPSDGALATESARLPFDQPDMVPQAVLDAILWRSVHGAASRPPAPGPNASPVERARAAGALRLLRAGRDASPWLQDHAGGDADG
jgi:YVTN family beta-propeller protein